MLETPNMMNIDQLAQGNQNFKDKILVIIKEELPIEIEIYKKHLMENKWLETAEDVHKLKHKISILGLERSYEIAVDYENDLKQGKIRLQSEFELILMTMIKFIEQF